MVSEGSGSPQYPPGPARYQALWWNTEGITMVSEGSGPLPDRARNRRDIKHSGGTRQESRGYLEGSCRQILKKS